MACLAVFHRPHPGKETDKGALKSMRLFLAAIANPHRGLFCKFLRVFLEVPNAPIAAEEITFAFIIDNRGFL